MLLQVSTRNGSKSATIYQHPESGVAVAFWGRLDNRHDLIAQLGAGHKACDDELIAQAWLKWGEHCPERLIGDFSFAVASPKTGVVFLVRDAMGVKPLLYRSDKNGIFFANSAAAFKPLKLGTLTRSQEWMARYMLDISQSHTDTAFVEIKKLPGAHSMLIHADGRMNIRRYHQFVDDAPVENKRDPKYLEAYQAVWQEAVRCRIPEQGPFGCENSGGLDSGSITAEIARQLGGDIDRLHTFGCCYSVLEPEYIMANPMKWGVERNTLFSHNRQRQDLAASNRALRVNGYPLEFDEGEFSFLTYQVCAEQSLSTLFSGFGGDEVMTTTKVLPIRLELFDQRQWHWLLKIMPGSLPARLLRVLKTVYRSKTAENEPMSWLSDFQECWNYQFLSAKVLADYDLKSNYFASASHEEGIRRINHLALKLLGSPYMSIRLENCSLMAASFGIDYAWPMQDRRLVQQWLSTPALWKIGDGGVARYFHRNAVAGVCADKVAWKKNKDMTTNNTKKKILEKDNRPNLMQLQELLHTLPTQLQLLIDAEKTQQIINQGLVDAWHGRHISPHINRLATLSGWIAES